MSDPFRIEGPAIVSFSGGRTSAYMLRRILDAGLAPDVHVLFANTGKERPETLTFVEQCAAAWRVQVHWIERERGEVTPAAASREGKPFAQLIADRRLLPNPVARFCTQELKIRPMRDYMRARGYDHWTNVVGIRADEPRRVAKMRGRIEADGGTRERWDVALPLADAGVTLFEVNEFWSRQPFDLALRPHEGNCDLCFLKAPRKRARIARERPDLLHWWVSQEAALASRFRNDAPEYAHLLDQLDLFADGTGDAEEEPDLIECYCHD